MSGGTRRGAQLAGGSLSRVLVTGGAGFIGRRVVRSVTGAEIPAEHVPPKPGEMPAVIIDISAARALGCRPGYDLKAGIATVWPEFSETAK